MTAVLASVGGRVTCRSSKSLQQPHLVTLGRAEQPRSGKAWDEARQIASRAMAGEADVKIISTATHYHADYVQPRWAGTMKRLIKIGRHVFYRDS